MSKRTEFIKRKKLKENLKNYNAFSLYGYYPLFNNLETAEIVSPLTSYHTHEFNGVDYYMPDGLEMGKTQFHGDYNQITPETTAQPEAIETPEVTPEVTQPEVIVITPSPIIIEPEEEPETTYTPPPSSRREGSGGY